MCRTGDRRLAARTGCGRGGQSRRAGPAGRGAGGAARGCGSDERRRVRGDERGGVRRAVGHEPGRLMVHSVELVFDPDTEAAVRHIWDGLREAGIPSQAPASRPHATLTVAERIDPEVDALLAPLRAPVPVPLPDRRAAVVRQGQGRARAAGGADGGAARRARRGASAVPAAPVARADGERAARPVDRSRHAGPPRRARPAGPRVADRG